MWRYFVVFGGWFDVGGGSALSCKHDSFPCSSDVWMNYDSTSRRELQVAGWRFAVDTISVSSFKSVVLAILMRAYMKRNRVVNR